MHVVTCLMLSILHEKLVKITSADGGSRNGGTLLKLKPDFSGVKLGKHFYTQMVVGIGNPFFSVGPFLV